MRPLRPAASRLALTLVALTALSPAAVAVADDFKIEPSKEAPPAALAAPVRESLVAEGFRVLDGSGKVYAEIWLRKGVPAAEKPAGPKGPVLYPFLAEGELLGAVRYPGQGSDNRDQVIPKGVYTLRYGLQPLNGDHLGVSVFRDYALLLPAVKDTSTAKLAKKSQEERSSESAGTSHPAILMLVAPAADAKAPAMVHEMEKDSWGAVVPLDLDVKGAPGKTSLSVQFVLIGVFGG